MQGERNFKNTVAALLITTLLIAVLPTECEGAIYDDTIRLHILANSDSEEDQGVKLAIRDRVLEKYSELLKSDGSMDEAKKNVTSRLDAIESDCKGWLEELGYGYGVKATLVNEWYDTRDYEGFSLPCGYYTSLKIELGSAEGKNWWCVMYPPMCLDIATEEGQEYTKSEQALISKNGYNVKFKLLELISGGLK